MTGRIELYVDDLILEGFASVDRRQIEEAVEREFVAIVSNHDLQGPTEKRAERSRPQTGAYTTPGNRVEEMGAHIARAVHGRLKG